MSRLKQFDCSACGVIFKRPQELGMHKRRAHGILGESPSAKSKRKMKDPVLWPNPEKQQSIGLGCAYCPNCGLNLKAFNQALEISNMKEFKHA